MDTKQTHKLRKFIKELASIRGRHTELISVYVPAGYDINKIIQHMEEEQGTASNIKDKTTRTHVIDSLERAIRHLRLFKKTPENGIAVFSGNASERDNVVDIKVWSLETPEPLKFRLYRCDQTFVIDPLKEMLEHKETYGLIVLDRREATIGLLRGTSISQLINITSGVPGKSGAGGQSSRRYERIREGMTKEFFVRIGELANKYFLDIKMTLKGILIGGPGPTKEEFFAGDYLNNEIKQKVLALQDQTYTDETGLHDLVDKSKEILAKEIIIKEKQLMQRFFEMLAKTPEKVSYGSNETKKALDFAAVDTLLLSDDLEESIIEEFIAKAESTNAKVELISTETREGQQLKDLGGIGAILRYALS